MVPSPPPLIETSGITVEKQRSEYLVLTCFLPRGEGEEEEDKVSNTKVGEGEKRKKRGSHWSRKLRYLALSFLRGNSTLKFSAIYYNFFLFLW